MMVKLYIGIDISKLSFDVYCHDGCRNYHRVFDNNNDGFWQFFKWLEKYNAQSDWHLVMESTNNYWQQLAYWAYMQGFCVSVINPLYIYAYSKSLGVRIKTDKSDACILARYGRHEQPKCWQPKPDCEINLQQLLKQYHNHQIQLVKERQKLENAAICVQDFICQNIEYWQGTLRQLEAAIWRTIKEHPQLATRADLLATIPGIGKKTIPWLLSLIGDGSRFDCAKNLVSFVGLAPRHYQSGTSIYKQSSIGFGGRMDIRAALFMPAVVVSFGRYPAFESFVTRLQSRGKCKKQIIVAVMRKLLTIAYAVIKYNQPYDERRHA